MARGDVGIITPSVSRWSRNDRSSSPSRLSVVCSWTGLRGPASPPVSGQRVSTRGVSLPSAGSRRARFPVVISTMEALRLPARAHLVPYGFGSRPHVFLLSVRARRSAPTERGGRSAGLGVWSAGCPFSGVLHPVGACGTSQVPWQSILCPCPAPGPRPSRQDLAFDGLVDTAPGN